MWRRRGAVERKRRKTRDRRLPYVMAESETHGVCMSKWPGMRRSARTRIAGYARAENDDAMNEHKDLVVGVWRGCLLATNL
jgi:hypothetical protein